MESFAWEGVAPFGPRRPLLWMLDDDWTGPLTFEQFDRFPGHSKGYSGLPEEMKRRFASDIPAWSEFIRQEAARFGFHYVDTSGDFEERLSLAAALLTKKSM